MKVVERVEELRRWREGILPEETIGFVPTMGAFHAGHLSLIRKARVDCHLVVVSVFVNPTQFGPGEDFQGYPREPEKDRQAAEKEGVDLLWFSDRHELYPPGFATQIELPALSSALCGRTRPHHFGGVALVVLKLLNRVRPQRAYFGLKDYQQFVLVRRMAADLDLPVEIVPSATVREPAGLACSSRNRSLSEKGRAAAAVLHQGLVAAARCYLQGERCSAAIVLSATRRILQEPMIQIEYVDVVDGETLRRRERADESAVLALAVRVEGVRLIDNIRLGDGAAL